MNEQEMVSENSELNQAEKTRDEEDFIMPPVDILENDEGLVLVADMPGVEKENLSIDIEGDMLTIKGQVCKEFLKGQFLMQEYEPHDYYRRFQILEGIDQEKAHADYTNGVLKLYLPKSEAARPRQIKIESK